jgi:Fanconi-associated nuclease 1
MTSKTPVRQFRATRSTTASAGNVKCSLKGEEKATLSLDDDELAIGTEQDDDVIAESPRVQDAKLVKEIFEAAFPRWKDLVRAEGEEDGRPAGLERFLIKCV